MKNKNRLLVAIMLLVCAVTLAAVNLHKAPKKIEAAPVGQASTDRLLITFKNNPAPGTTYRSEISTLSTLPAPTPVYQATLKPGVNLQTVVNSLKADPNVQIVEADYRVHILATPDDPLFGSSGSWEQDFDDQWGLTTTGMEEAWDTSTGSRETIIAVIDTGLDYTHTDINDNVWYNPGEVINIGMEIPEDDANGNGIIDCYDMIVTNHDHEDTDENGYVDDICGWNYVDATNDPRDDEGHGTHVSGIIAAETDNASGMAGMCWNCTIMPLRFMSADGGGWISDAIRAINYAIENGATVINLSWGGTGYSESLQSVIDAAYEAGVVVVAASGNTNTDVGTLMPANMDHVITVAALGSNGQYKAPYSNFGEEIDFVAPGEAILSLNAHDPTDEQQYLGSDSVDSPVVSDAYIAFDGTSMAAPYVSGLIALMRAAHPTWEPFHIEYVLENTATDIYDEGIAAGRDVYTGYGLPDPVAAMTATVDATAPTAVLTATPSLHTNFRSTDIAVGPVEEVTHYRFRIDNGPWSATPVPQQLHITLSNLLTGDHTLYVIARDEIGNWQSIDQATTYSWNIDYSIPARITTLAIVDTSPSTVALTWTATGDDGATGTAASYQIRYATTPLTDATWSAATVVTHALTPAPAGTAGEAITVSGLGQLATYYFGIKAVDNAGNLSPLSNIVTSTTLTDGSAVLVRGSSRAVYLLEYNVLHLFPSDRVFLGLGYNWADVRTMTDATLDQFEIGTPMILTFDPGDVVKTADSATVYLITADHEQRPFACAAVFFDNELTWQDVIIVDQASLDDYTPGELITSELCTAEPDATTDGGQTDQDESEGGDSANPDSDSDRCVCDGQFYIIRSGDTLYQLAIDFNTTVSALARTNHITNIHRIYPGQVLNLNCE